MIKIRAWEYSNNGETKTLIYHTKDVQVLDEINNNSSFISFCDIFGKDVTLNKNNIVRVVNLESDGNE